MILDRSLSAMDASMAFDRRGLLDRMKKAVAARIGVVETAYVSPPSSLPAGSAAFLATATGWISCPTVPV